MNWQAATPTAGQANPSGPMVDADHDGLADVWELANGLDPQIASGTNGASADNDGDGANNLHEYIAGTNPNNAADYLHFTRAFVENQLCKLEFNSRTGRTYGIEYVNTLGPSIVWNTLASGISGTGGSVTVSDPQIDETRYYRLRVALSSP
jgi:hypothetical protein